jgi:hypothetical protein
MPLLGLRSSSLPERKLSLSIPIDRLPSPRGKYISSIVLYLD